jgi:hypothetical protein
MTWYPSTIPLTNTPIDRPIISSRIANPQSSVDERNKRKPDVTKKTRRKARLMLIASLRRSNVYSPDSANVDRKRPNRRKQRRPGASAKSRSDANESKSKPRYLRLLIHFQSLRRRNPYDLMPGHGISNPTRRCAEHEGVWW